ncbi:MAG: DUF4197 domain-containing protein [Deferribacteraceae bacterium]|jgi:hypothetical protein|nr:DUF4197 domain-containing protein [Deferribacteraceae bacterium]
MKRLLLIVTLLIFAGCVTGQQARDMLEGMRDRGSVAPTSEEIAAGLKEALKVGSTDAAGLLSAAGGYYLNDAYKILLPPDGEKIVTNIAKIPGGQKMVDDVILRINTAAENAASTAAPIFVDAITEMTIADALGILKGGDDAATQYLYQSTSAKLKETYRPYLKAALDKPLVAGISATQSWDVLTSSYNKVASSIVGKVAGMSTVDSDLEDYVLDKAIAGMFGELAEQEKEIRADPLQYASDIIKKVFSYAKTVRE